MSAPPDTIRNIGPETAAAFVRAGLPTAEAISDAGADAAYRALLVSGVRPHFIGYYALVMGLQGRPWNDCRGEEKAALRKRFDAIKASLTPEEAAQSEIEAQLDALGVGLRR